LLKDPRVAQEVRRRIAEVTKRYRSTANKALGELAALAFSNVKDYYDRDGKLLPLDELPVYAAAAVKKVKSKEVKAFDLATGEEKVVGHERELELHDKIAALRMIGQHEGLFAEPEGQGGNYRMAAGMDPNLAALVDSTMAGEPFDAATEKAAKDKGWK